MAYQAKTGRKVRGSNPRHKAFNAADRQAEVRQLYAQLDEWEKDQAAAEIAELLARFADGYHGRNPGLIAMQDPAATDVDAYKAWVERGRRPVGKGYGIKIIRPGHKWYEDDPNNPGQKIEHISYFIGHVYDIRHTVTDTPEDIKAWRDAHPDNQW